MNKEYEFEVNITLQLSTQGKNEQEARGKLTEAMAQYLSETEIDISEEEAKLLEVRDN